MVEGEQKRVREGIRMEIEMGDEVKSERRIGKKGDGERENEDKREGEKVGRRGAGDGDGIRED